MCKPKFRKNHRQSETCDKHTPEKNHDRSGSRPCGQCGYEIHRNKTCPAKQLKPNISDTQLVIHDGEYWVIGQRDGLFGRGRPKLQRYDIKKQKWTIKEFNVPLSEVYKLVYGRG